MNRNLIGFLLVAVLAIGCSVASAGPITHYNVDWQTLPNGPVELVNVTVANPSGGNWVLSGGAKNNDIKTYQDVKFLVQFVYDPTSGLVYNDGTDTWSGNGNSAVIGSPSGFFNMTNTDAPLSFTVPSPSRTGNVGPNDTLPFIQIGDILAGQTVNFSLNFNQTPRFVPFNLVGSFISATPIPEPSTWLLLTTGAIGLFAVARRRART